MNIRWKVTASIAAIFAVLCAAELFVSRAVLLPSFASLESSEADIAMRRIDSALEATLEQLQLSATGWGNWTDTYRFALDHNPRFIAENVTVIGLKQLNSNVVLVVDTTGQVLSSAAIDLKSGRDLDLELAHWQQLPEAFPWRSHLSDGQEARGLLPTRQGILMVVAAPILDGFGQGPVHGLVLMGRLLSDAEVARIGSQAQARLSLLPAAAGGTPGTQRVSDDVLQVFHHYNDIYGKPILTLRVDLPREITSRGASAVHYASACLTAAAVIALGLLVLMLNRLVLNPLAVITRHAVAIGEDRNLTHRLQLHGADEIGVLARELDRMVERLAESRSQLVDQSFQAGFAEQAKGVLHNLGNAMTPLSVRLSILASRLRAAPIEDADLAIAELAHEQPDAQRRTDLQHFLCLASSQLTDALRAAGQDLEVMSRQAAIVQHGLSEQMHATRNEHVIEAVRLPELLAQSLDVVPDSARQRLSIEQDRSLQTAGVVKIPRTVLRLVLQNIIINAADAVRDSGRARGVLRLSAERTRSTDGSEQLSLHCADNGAGIVPENLARIFEKGFSTKSKDTNFGIGLHWCANAIGALGGRIWASSEGAGQGATIHVSVPLAEREGLTTIRAA
jgi:two-component system, NtrC family, sensor kinase